MGITNYVRPKKVRKHKHLYYLWYYYCREIISQLNLNDSTTEV